MEGLNSFISTIKTNIMKKMINFTDPQYYLLKFKPVLAEDQKRFIELYQNIFFMQALSLLSLIPSMFFLRRASVYKKNIEKFTPGYTKEGHEKIMRSFIRYLTFGTSLAVCTLCYDYANDFKGLLKQIGNREKEAMSQGKIVQIQL